MSGANTPEDQGTPEQQQSIPMIAVVALLLVSQFFFSYGGAEPYPSVAMPGFEGGGDISDDPRLISVAHLRLEANDQSRVLSRSELFESAPPNQQNRMMGRFETLSGSEAEWEFFDAIAERYGLGPVADSVELIRLDGYGTETAVHRIERQR